MPRRSPAQHLISATVFGGALLACGLAGLDLRHSHGWFAGARWVDPPVWWEVGAGVALLCVAVVLARRMLRREQALQRGRLPSSGRDGASK